MNENDVAKYALSMLYTSQKCMKIALSVAEAQPGREAEVETLQHRLEAVDWLIGIAIKEA